jgi:hypothetical protein
MFFSSSQLKPNHMVLPDQNKCIVPFDPLWNVNDEDGHKEVRS